jgi:chloramphenicol-sensitive protein RarD
MTGSENHRTGLIHALAAYTIWGLLPLYLWLLHDVPALEFVGWRVIFTLPLCLILVMFDKQWPALMAAISDRRTLIILLASSLLIAVNWIINITAIQSGHVLSSSLGYYINPLINVLLGTLLLGERLSGRQWLAVAIAAAGVALLAFGAADMLWISVSLALSFGLYGVVRKLAPVESLPGLTIESLVLLLPGMAIIAYSAQGMAMGRNPSIDLLLALSSVFTAVPLLLFASSARKMDYSTLGFVQFLTPSISFALGLFVFKEPLRPIQLACFAMIWIAIALFVADLLARRKVST